MRMAEGYFRKYLPNIVIKALHATLKRWGTSSAKILVWDREFLNGQWEYLDDAKIDIIYFYLEKYSRDGSILDLGCGSGNTGNEINESKYKLYTGVDISKTAIQKAIIRCKENTIRNKKNEYFVSDIANYNPQKKYNAILFRESIYYIPKFQIKKVLDKYSNFLNGNGVFIVRIWNKYKHKSIIRIIEKNYRLVEKYSPADSKTVVLVFNEGRELL